jgi:nitrogen fixation/metabolism regulation signal transduction histidine kinase
LNRLRNRLIAIFLLATLVPLGLTAWIAARLLDQSLRLASTRELDQASRSLEATGRALYVAHREALERDVAAGRLTPRIVPSASPEAQELVPGTFLLHSDRLEFVAQRGSALLVYSRPTGIDLPALQREYAQVRSLVEATRSRDLRRGFFVTLAVVMAAVWILSAIALVYWAHRISRPIHSLTGGLAQVAAGNLDVQLEAEGQDEVGHAIRAFNDTARQLKQSQERLVYLTRLSSWQTLARKMAHEVKNSLTPIRLTMEELTARGAGDKFIEQAAQIVVDEVGTLERRVRAFSEFASEPPVKMSPVDTRSIIQERLALLRNAHPGVIYNTRLEAAIPALADEDLLKSVLTNLIENAADAAGPGGVVQVSTRSEPGRVFIEVHDSGPGLSRHAKDSLFQPTISFKKTGMGLGLSVAHRSALLCGGDIVLIDGELGGAAFRVTLRAAEPESCPPNESLSSTTKRTSAVPSA